MGILDFLSGEFIDVIHWTDDTRDTMVWRFEREGHEIKYGAKLTVREGQAAVFVHEGQLADTFMPGLYMLETNNLPIMTKLQHWDHGFRSPFKSEVYLYPVHHKEIPAIKEQEPVCQSWFRSPVLYAFHFAIKFYRSNRTAFS